MKTSFSENYDTTIISHENEKNSGFQNSDACNYISSLSTPIIRGWRD